MIAGLQAVGASSAEAASGLFAVCIAVAITNVVAALTLRIPLAFAWSTPGAAVLLAAATPGLKFSDAVGAFLVSAALMLLCGLWPLLGRAITRIP
ncbi:MAG TPA: benzoate/H(+) symporter BenE family transporter, partial [Rhodoglobus sp.]|nr:benzoate/H(+) symporter BenE family transporter [Rhodoglobus sp.]HQE47184.1 benzoate/H(+) symporter BenE family transporter [Rhodoglobus sp.]